MTKVIMVVREAGRLGAEHSMTFNVPEIPQSGHYISVRQNKSNLWSEDYIVRKIWWSLQHDGSATTTGSVTDITLECDIACGPYASKKWQKTVEIARSKGVDVENFETARFIVGQENSNP